MKVDKAKLAAQIEAMKSVCGDGRREVRELVETLIGEKLPAHRDPEPGQVYSALGNRYVLVGFSEGFVLANPASGKTYSGMHSTKEAAIAGAEFVAQSLRAHLLAGGEL